MGVRKIEGTIWEKERGEGGREEGRKGHEDYDTRDP